MGLGITSTSIIAVSALFNCDLADVCGDNVDAEAWLKNENGTFIAREVQEVETVETLEGIPVAHAAAFNPLIKAAAVEVPAQYRIDVPFTAQAPHKSWVPPYDEACEEASLTMVEYYLRGNELDIETADYEIHQILAYEEDFGWGVDIGTEQVEQISDDKYGRNTKRYTGAFVSEYNIEHLIAADYPIIVPVAGRDLGNPNFIGDGPPFHMIVLVGYDSENFVAHDPGTQFGENYRYPKETVMSAIHEWTGDRATIREGEKAILVMGQAKF
ncbi:C39 family peptidase [Pseudomonadota bacterium]